MAPKRKRMQIIIIFLFFIAYFLLAARSVPREAILAPVWLSSLETPADDNVSAKGQLLPFTLGSRFGYINTSGQFAVNTINTGLFALDEKMWTEYSAEPASIEIKDTSGNAIININSPRGYPILLDNRVFIISSEMNALSEIDSSGNIKWSYEFGSILTCIDVASGLVLTGSLDGVVEILDSNGNRIYYFEPGGSRFETIYGCALSKDGSRVAIISGIEPQRFLLLERFGSTGGDYKVVYHDFLDAGFRRAVLISFIDEDRRVVYERSGGIGCYNLRSRRAIFIPLEGEITAIDTSGNKGLFFLIAFHSQQPSLSRHELIGIKLPQDRRFGFSKSAITRDAVFLRAPFKTDDIFLSRKDSQLIIGGGSTLISFNLEEK